MPDIMQLVVTPLASANVNVPRATISCKVVSSRLQSIVLADFTGANTLAFPAILTSLTAADQRELVEYILPWLLQKRAPNAWK